MPSVHPLRLLQPSSYHLAYKTPLWAVLGSSDPVSALPLLALSPPLHKILKDPHKDLAYHACSSSCCRCLARLCRRSLPPDRPHYQQHMRCHQHRSPPQQQPPLAILDQLWQAQVLYVHVRNHPNRLPTTRTHPSCSDTLDQYLRIDSVTRAAVDVVGLATVRSFVATAVRLFSQSPFSSI